QAEDGIRDFHVTGVQTCALPIFKERLNSRDALRLVSSLARPQLELWLNQHVEHGRKLAELVIRQAQARSRAAQKVEKKKSSGVAVLPGKLTDCESTDIARNELFLV